MATNQTFVDYQTPIPADWLNNVNNKVNILANKGTDIASAAAIDLGAATGDYVVITGTTTITSLGTASAGTERTLVFSGVLTLTHNVTSLILPGGVDIVTDVGDVATFRSEGSGNWRCTGYQSNINDSLGYGIGAGGAVTQSTSKSTAVTLNKPCGQITMNNAALAAGAEVSFTVNNTLVTTSDSVLISPLWATVNPNNYQCRLTYVGGGAFGIAVKNISAGSLSEALIINFAIIKGATS